MEFEHLTATTAVVPAGFDNQPDVDEVLQAETTPEPAVLVRTETPIRTQELPHKAGGTLTKTVGTTPVRLLAADHRRARAEIISIGQNMYFAYSQASAQDTSRMALWPAGTPKVITTLTEVWVCSATSTTSVSASTELWATGE